jgi:hypothetical protein
MTNKVVDHLVQHSGDRFYMAGMIGGNNYRIGAVPVARNQRDVGKSEYTHTMRMSLGLANFIFVFKERVARGKK